MTAPGAGEGVSWIDVAASAAGIAAQMKDIGVGAAGAMAEGFNSHIGSAGSGMGRAVGQSLGKEVVAGLGESLAVLGPTILARTSLPDLGSLITSGSGNASAVALGEAMASAMARGFAAKSAELSAAVRSASERAADTAIASAERAAAAEVAAAKAAADAITAISEKETAARAASYEQVAAARVAAADKGVAAEAAAAERAAAANAAAAEKATAAQVSLAERLEGQLAALEVTATEKKAAAADARAAADAAGSEKGAAAKVRAAERAEAAADAAEAKVTAAAEAAGAARAGIAEREAAATAAATARSAAERVATESAATAQISASYAAAATAAEVAAGKALSAQRESAEGAAAAHTIAAQKAQEAHLAASEKIGVAAADLGARQAGEAEKAANKTIAEAERAAAGHLQAFERLVPQLSSKFSQLGTVLTQGVSGGSSGMGEAFSRLNQELIPLMQRIPQLNQLMHEAMNPGERGPNFAEEIAGQLPAMQEAVGRMGRLISAGVSEGTQSGAGEIINKLLSVVAPGLSKLLPGITDVGLNAGKIWTKSYAEEAAKLPNEMLPTADAVGTNFGGKMAEVGKASGLLMKAGIIGAVVGVVDLMVHLGIDIVNGIENEFGKFAKIGADAANNLMDSFKSIVDGKAPDIGASFNIVEDAIHTGLEAPLNGVNGAIDATVGHIPIIGTAFEFVGSQATGALSAVFGVFDELKGLTGDYLGVLEEVGTKWTEAAREIAGQTVDDGGMERSLDVMKEIMASGALVHFKDISEAVGELGQRLSGLGDGAGLSQSELKDLTQTLAEGNEVLGNIHINVDNLTAAFNDFNIAPEKTNEELETLVNISRETGAGLNDMLNDIDQVGPSMQEMGYDLDQTTLLMAKMNQQLGDPAMNRMAFGLAQIQDRFAKMGTTDAVEGLKTLIQTTKDIDAGGSADADTAAEHYLKQFVGSARTAETILAGIKDGIFETPEQLQKMLDDSSEVLHQPLDDALEQTKSLGDAFEQIGSQMLAALAPVGLGLVGALRGATNHISDWIKENQVTIIQWAGKIGDAILEGARFLADGVAAMLDVIAPYAQALKTTVAAVMVGVAKSIEPILNAMSLLPGSLGDAAKSADNDLKSIIPTLEGIRDKDITGPMKSFADQISGVANSEIPKLENGLDGIVSKAADIAAVGHAFVQNFTDAEGHAHHLEDAFEKTKEGGFKILGGQDVVKSVQDQLGQLGIHLQVGGDGTVGGVSAETAPEAEAFKQWWEETFRDKSGKPEALPGTTPGAPGQPADTDVPVVPILQNPNDPTALPRALGVPSEQMQGGHLQIPTTLVPTPGAPLPPGQAYPGMITDPATGGLIPDPNAPQPAAPPPPPPPPPALPPPPAPPAPASPPEQRQGSGIWGHPSAFDGGGMIMPAGFDITTGTELSATELMNRAGVTLRYQGQVPGAGGAGVLIPTGFSVGGTEPLDGADLLSRAGIGTKYQGDVAGVGADGVVLPTAFDVKDSTAPKSVQQVMDAAGVPTQNQNSEGVVLDVAFNMPTTGPTTGPSGGGAAFAGGGNLWNQFAQQNGLPPSGGGSGGGAGGGGRAFAGFPTNDYSGAGGGDIQAWLGQQLQAAGLSPDEAHGIMAMNAVEGGAKDPKSLLGFTESQAQGPSGHLQAFLKQWNDPSRRPGGQLPGVGPDGNVVDWDAFMTWIRERIVGQNGSPSDWQGNAQPNPQDYQNRLMQALKAIMGSGGGNTVGFAEGGEVGGPWTPGRDTIPMDLESGSFVVNRAMSQQHRGLLDGIQRRGGKGGRGGKMIPSILEAGERLFPPDVAGPNMGLLRAVNGGALRALKGGGAADPNAPGADLQGWLAGELSGAGLTSDQARGILAMNIVEGGSADPKSLLGFTESQVQGPQAHVQAFLRQWNDMSRRPGGRIPGMSPTGSVVDWPAYMAWIREKIVGQTGNPSDFQGNAQPAASDYQNRLMQALQSVHGGAPEYGGGGRNIAMAGFNIGGPVLPFAGGGSVGFYSKPSRVPISSSSINIDKHFAKSFAGGGSVGFYSKPSRVPISSSSINIDKHFAKSFNTGGGVDDGKDNGWAGWLTNPMDKLMRWILGDKKPPNTPGPQRGPGGIAARMGGRIGFDGGGEVSDPSILEDPTGGRGSHQVPGMPPEFRVLNPLGPLGEIGRGGGGMRSAAPVIRLYEGGDRAPGGHSKVEPGERIYAAHHPDTGAVMSTLSIGSGQDDSVYVNMVKTKPQYQGQGLAKALLERMANDNSGRLIDPGVMTELGQGMASHLLKSNPAYQSLIASGPGSGSTSTFTPTIPPELDEDFVSSWMNRMTGKRAGGRIGRASGGAVPDTVTGHWVPGRDTIPMDLPSGSFVVNRAMSQQHSGLIDNLMKTSGKGHAGGKTIPSILEVGERLIPPDIAGPNLPMLHAVNGGMFRKLQGGGSVDEAEAWAQFASGQPYNRDGYLDCSGYVSSVWGVMSGAGPGRHFDTTAFSSDASAAKFGFHRGFMPGAFNIAVRPLPGQQGHMIGELPNGVVIESGGSDNMIKYGSNTSMDSLPDHFFYMPAGADGGGNGQDPNLGVDGAGGTFNFADSGGGGGGGGGGLSGGGIFENAGGGKGRGGSGGGGSVDPGDPQVNAPTAPGSNYSDVGPPPEIPRVAPNTPNAVQTPFGWFQYPDDMPDGGAGMRPEEKKKVQAWLLKQEGLNNSAANDQTSITDAQTRADDPELQANKDKADTEMAEQQKLLDAAKSDAEKQQIMQTPDYIKAAKDEATATKALTDAHNGLAKATQNAHKNHEQQLLDADTAPPWEKDAKGKGSSAREGISSEFGKGLVQGVLQELGFPDVFGKDPTQWGITKLLMGGLGYGAGLLQNMGSLGGGTGQQQTGLLGGASGALGVPGSLWNQFNGGGDAATGGGGGGGGGGLGIPQIGVTGQGPLPGPGDGSGGTGTGGTGTGGSGGGGAGGAGGTGGGRTVRDRMGTQLTIPPDAPAGDYEGSGVAPPGWHWEGQDGGPQTLTRDKPTAGGQGGAGGQGAGGQGAGQGGGGAPPPPPGHIVDHTTGKSYHTGPGGMLVPDAPAGPPPPGTGQPQGPGLRPPPPAPASPPQPQLPVPGNGFFTPPPGMAPRMFPSSFNLGAANGGDGPTVFQAAAWNPGGPAPAANTPAMVGSSTPTAIETRDGGPGNTVNNPLTVNNTYQGFNPTPQVKDQVKSIATTTSAPAMAGGQMYL